MNIKSITTLCLVAAAMVITSITPAEAHDNKKALNQLAMQYYMQNQAAAGRNTIINPALVNNYTYGYGQTPWSAGVIPGYTTAISPWTTSVAPWNSAVVPVNTVVNPYGCGAGNGINNVAYGTIVSPQYNNLTQQIANLQARLATNNLNAFQVARLQSEIAKLQAKTNGLAATGYGSPYGYRANVFNNLRSAMRI